MAEFTPITTQEQFDAAIGERLKREREAAARKYGDYDSLQKKVTEYERQIGDLNRTISESAEKYAGYDQTLAQLQARVKGYETEALKTRVALEAGLPYALAARLTGETEADIQKDAKALVQLMGSTQTEPPPLRTAEPGGKESRREALRALNAQLTGND